MTPDELQEILRLHGMWLRGEDGGARADLSKANLIGANLRLANLGRADLSMANLREANLNGADLREADLRWANIREANLIGANLRGADLRGADLRWANLREANLNGADLREADLREANLSGVIGGAVCRMDFGGWSICVRATETSIGCQQHPNEKWLAWLPVDVAFMHADARDWWADHGEAIKAAIRCVMAKAAKAKEAT